MSKHCARYHYESGEFPSGRPQDIDEDIVSSANVLMIDIERLPASREKSIAITKLDEMIMWCKKALQGME